MLTWASFAWATAAPAVAHDWPQWLGPQRDGVWRESGLVEKFPDGGPKIRWRAKLGIGYSGPAIVGQRLFITDLLRPTDDKGQPLRATRKGIPGTERVLCLNTDDGSTLWTHQYDCPYTISYPSGPRTTPVVDGATVYALGAMGDLVALDAASGTPRWTKNLAKTYRQEVPVWGHAAHPLVDGELLFTLVGGPDSAIVALNKHSGEEVWRALTSEEVGYSPPMIYDLAGKRQLIVWLSDAIYGLDPATGKQFWKHAYPDEVPPQRPAVNIITVKLLDDMLFVSTFYHGPMMLRVAANDEVSVVWKGSSNNPVRPDGAHCLMASPVFKDGIGYGNGSLGELRAFDARTGQEHWQNFAPVTGRKADCGTVFIVPQGDRFVMFNDQGELILANLDSSGYHQIDRARILDPVSVARGRDIVWSHPAFAHRSVFARNDKEIVCVLLAAEEGEKS